MAGQGEEERGENKSRENLVNLSFESKEKSKWAKSASSKI